MDTPRRYDVQLVHVGVKELTQHLSEYLDRAEQGEMLLVTARGRPKAVLGPLPRKAPIEEGIAEGWITPGSGARLGKAHRAEGTRRVLKALAEDRGG